MDRRKEYLEKADLLKPALLDETDGAEALRRRIEARSAAAVARLYDGERGLFVSGADRQVSWASQVWFALADVLPREDALRALENVALDGEAAIMVSPYMMHHYVDALYHLGCPEKAHQVMMDYWGGMVRLGADTFFELYNPANPDESPYGSPIVNSYCHAWSCNPIYLLGRYRAGVRRTGVGYQTFEVAPRLGDLKRFDCTVPLPAGEVRVRMDGERLTVLATAAGGTLVFGGQRLPLQAGQEVSVAVR